MATPARPLIDRRRSSSRSRDRGALQRRPTLQTSHSSSSVGAQSPISSPVGSPPALHSILKHHPAEDEDRGRRARTGDGAVEGSMSTLALGGVSANDSSTPADQSDWTSATEDSGTATPATTAASTSGNGSGGKATQFKRRVGFDTWGAGEELADKAKATGGGTGVAYSFTLAAKSAEYCRTRWSRTFLVATDLNEYSVNATDWLLQSFVEDSDEVVVLRVIEPGSSAHNAWRASMEEARDEAEKVLYNLMAKNGERKHISLIVEFAIGPIEETIHRMIEIYKPDSLVVGTRGRPDSLFKSAFMGSISRWAVARSPVPVVVVRPDAKVREALERRLQDQKRGRSYVSLLTEEERRRFLPPATPSALSTTTTRTAASSSAESAGSGSGMLGPLSGSPLERIVTAPEARKSGEYHDSSSASSGGAAGKSGGGLKAAFGLGKSSGGGKKKDKGKEFKRFGTFS